MEFIDFDAGDYHINVMNESGVLILDRPIVIEEDTHYMEIELLKGKR